MHLKSCSQTKMIFLTPHLDRERRFVIILQLAKDTLSSKTQFEMSVFYTVWCAEVGPATHLCGPLGISRTVNLNCATNSPGHEKKRECTANKMPLTVVLQVREWIFGNQST